MSEKQEPFCPECVGEPGPTLDLDRRDFIRVVGVKAAAVAGVAGLAGASLAADTPPAKSSEAQSQKPMRPAEELVKELYASLTAEQKTKVVLPYNEGARTEKDRPLRLGMFNSPILGRKIADNYTKAQEELIERIVRAISSDDEGFRRISRNGTYDTSGSLRGCSATLFGEPADGKDWSWVFAGHHLTIRCDGRPADGVGFGGPMYYGHSPSGYSERNVFFYQTKSVLSVFDALDEKQRKAAVVTGTPGEQAPSVKFRDPGQPRPGLACTELTRDQKALVETVMHDVLSPYRKEDADEVMAIVKATGGLDKIHLAFYQQKEMGDNHRWHFWRLEGPGMVWNFRVLPHVHTFVNVAGKV